MKIAWVRSLGVVALFLAAALFGTASGVLFAFVGDLPEIRALDDYSPSTITRVYGRDGGVVGEFAAERRQVVTYEQIPEVLRHAIMAAEDGDFATHGGFHPLLMAWAAGSDLVSSGRTPGRSTITQQLARQLFPESLGFERAWIRKIREALVALQIEKRYTKNEIFTMYCNKVAWGNRAFGVEAASRLYFDKAAKDLTLNEAATIAGMLPAPQRLNPYANIQGSTRRRNYTLDRMVEEGFITAAQAAETKKQPIVTRGQPSQPPSIAPYFLESIRTRLEESYGAKAVYENGLTVRTGLDPRLQLAANHALDTGLRTIDRERGYRKPSRNLLDEKRALDTYRHPRWAADPVEGAIVPAVVMALEASEIQVRVGRWRGTIDRDGYKWTNRKTPQDLVRVGDLIEVKVGKLDAKATTLTGNLEQVPLLEGAVVAIDNHTGQVLAMIGGSSFDRSQFNRATQAMRQVGSLYKPFVYTAAIDRGYTARSEIVDEPVSYNAGPGQPPYEPKNYDREYHGAVTLRTALAGSRNVPAIKLMAALGPAEVNRYARQLGITSPLPNFLSVAIGAAEGTLMEMTSAYSAFPNQGVRMEPILLLDVTDREGNVLEQHRPQPHESIRADTAYIITNLLESVIQEGTAVSAKSLNWTLGGKTGTTDDYTDAWFIGFDPDITVGIWLGYDQKRPIGRNTGTTAALPIWKEIMKTWIERRRAEVPEPPDFERPGNVVTSPTDRGPEVFIAGTQPGRGGGQ